MTISYRLFDRANDEHQLRTFQCADSALVVTATYQQQIRSMSILDHPDFAAEAIVALSGTTVVGVAIFGPAKPPTWTIRMLAVARNRRREGIGTELKRQAIMACARRGAERVVSSVHATNLPMQLLNFNKFRLQSEDDPGLGESDPHLMYTAVIATETVDSGDQA